MLLEVKQMFDFLDPITSALKRLCLKKEETKRNVILF
jgi:hypothetical protein